MRFKNRTENCMLTRNTLFMKTDALQAAYGFRHTVQHEPKIQKEIGWLWDGIVEIFAFDSRNLFRKSFV